MAIATEFVSQLRAVYTVMCRRHNQPMAFVPQGNGSGFWSCQRGCEVGVAINWKFVKVINGGGH